MEYPKKIVEDFTTGKITRGRFKILFSAYQKRNGLNYDCIGSGDKNGIYVTYRGQKAEIRNGILEWNYGKKRTAHNLFEYKRKIDNQILREQGKI